MGVKACSTCTAGAVQERRILQLFLAGIQIHQQFQHFVCDLVQTGIGAVDLIDDHNDLQVHFQSLGQYETCLGHRTLCGINQQNGTVYHAQYTLYLAAEVSVSRCINDIDLGIAVAYRSILCQNRDTAFPFQIVGVHDTFCHSLIFTEHAALFQHFVYQRCLTVVNVCDNGNISQILTNHNSLLIPMVWVSRTGIKACPPILHRQHRAKLMQGCLICIALQSIHMRKRKTGKLPKGLPVFWWGRTDSNHRS